MFDLYFGMVDLGSELEGEPASATYFVLRMIQVFHTSGLRDTGFDMSDVATSLSVIADRWLLLIHQLPAKPAYLRVKVWRRLRALGAVAVKNAVHALPPNEQTQEDFEWLLKEITEGGGEA